MTPQMGLFFSAIAFVGLHFLLSHPLRDPLVRRLGAGPFQGIYSLIAIVALGAMIHYYSVIGDEPQLWVAGDAAWLAASILMWFGAILFVARSSAIRRCPARGSSAAERLVACSRSPGTR